MNRRVYIPLHLHYLSYSQPLRESKGVSEKVGGGGAGSKTFLELQTYFEIHINLSPKRASDTHPPFHPGKNKLFLGPPPAKNIFDTLLSRK